MVGNNKINNINISKTTSFELIIVNMMLKILALKSLSRNTTGNGIRNIARMIDVRANLFSTVYTKEINYAYYSGFLGSP